MTTEISVKMRSPSAAFLLLLLLMLAACVTREPSPQDLLAKRFDAIPDRSVVYLYRDRPDFVDTPTSFMLDGRQQGTTYPGTYYRLELPAGRHRIAGFAGDAGQFEFDTQPGKIYFIQQSVSRIIGFDQSSFYPVSEWQGRNSVLRSELMGAR